MAEEYPEPDRNASPDHPERRGASRRSVIEAAKVTVRTIDLADLLCGPTGNRSGLRQIGDKWVGICPLRDCASWLPSFAVWPDTDTWGCYACLRGGGVTDLVRLAGDELVAKAQGR
jgi:hypothetical protein